jgi:hypothetical protein
VFWERRRRLAATRHVIRERSAVSKDEVADDSRNEESRGKARGDAGEGRK